jgi:ADP-ribose pyrophosphatase YjhB (NUDIX family)
MEWIRGKIGDELVKRFAPSLPSVRQAPGDAARMKGGFRPEPDGSPGGTTVRSLPTRPESKILPLLPKAGGMEQDVVGAGDQWVPEDDYELIKANVPILCVDVLLSPSDNPQQVALIRRATYEGGDGWCLVGGRVLRNEHLSAAVERHVAATLGAVVQVDRSTLELGAVIEYFTEPGIGDFYDPRKHAVALTYSASCECTGEPEALGEAFEFGWFKIDQLSEVNFGFGQGDVVARVLKKLGRI